MTSKVGFHIPACAKAAETWPNKLGLCYVKFCVAKACAIVWAYVDVCWCDEQCKQRETDAIREDSIRVVDMA